MASPCASVRGRGLDTAVARLEYRDVAKRFPDVGIHALTAFNLEVPDGAFVVMLGPSGCGKTTALRVLAGLEAPTEGAVFIGDRDVTPLPPRNRDVAMVFQSYALYPHMSIADNIGYPLRIRKVPKADRKAAVERAAMALEIEPLLDRLPKQLSGGQRQRVALARAIVRSPAAFLMDEPLSNLDATLRTAMRAEIKRLQKELETTMVYVTHDQAEAMTMADLIVVMNAGEVQQVDRPNDVYERPANRFVATFLGNPPMNIIAGAIDADSRSFVSGGARLPVGDNVMRLSEGQGPLEMGIRPEDLSLRDPNPQECLCGEVYVVEPTGTETLVYVDVNGERVVARGPRDWTAEIGTPVGLAVDLSRAVFFSVNGAGAASTSKWPDRSMGRDERLGTLH
jgi:multiple sugar transport system ATP-binding protein